MPIKLNNQEEIIATFPASAGIDVVTIDNLTIVARHPAIGFVVTSQYVDIGCGIKPDWQNWTRPVTVQGIVELQLVYPDGRVDRKVCDFSRTESFPSLEALEAELREEDELWQQKYGDGIKQQLKNGDAELLLKEETTSA